MKYSFFLSFIMIFIYGCSSSKEVQSSFNDKVVIDGKREDWGSILKYDEDQKIAFGFLNDNNFMYLAVVTPDRDASRKILMNGLTVWVESSEGKIGIRYPLKMDPEQLRELRLQHANDQERDPSKMINLLVGRGDLQVITAKQIPLYTNLADAGDSFRGKIGYENDQLVYELRIPLKGNDITDRVFKNNITEVDIDIETGEVTREGMKGKGPGTEMGEGGMGEGGPMGQGGGGNMGGGGMRPPMGERDSGPLDYSFTVILKK